LRVRARRSHCDSEHGRRACAMGVESHICSSFGWRYQK
jgi:hypothetical protein